MPRKNSRKIYVDNGYYHIYNRGVEKRIIFQDDQDYGVFLSYLKECLLPKGEKELHKQLSGRKLSPSERDKVWKLLKLKNFYQEITLLAYCLMPNHFHLLIKQRSPGSIHKLMNSFGTRYTMYFNRKYKRVGSLYEGVYKAVLINSDEQFLHLSRYIHKQSFLQGEALQGQPSSYSDYIGARNTSWVHPEEILDFFSKTNPSFSYESFVQEDENIDLIKNIILE